MESRFDYEVYENDILIFKGRRKEVVDYLDMSYSGFEYAVKHNTPFKNKYYIKKIERTDNIFDYIDEDGVVHHGTISDISKETGISTSAIYYRLKPETKRKFTKKTIVVSKNGQTYFVGSMNELAGKLRIKPETILKKVKFGSNDGLTYKAYDTKSCGLQKIDNLYLVNRTNPFDNEIERIKQDSALPPYYKTIASRKLNKGKLEKALGKNYIVELKEDKRDGNYYMICLKH